MSLEVEHLDSWTIKGGRGLTCVQRTPVADEWVAYAGYISHLLDSPLVYCQALSQRHEMDRSWIMQVREDCDLILWDQTGRTGWQRLLNRLVDPWMAEQASASLLVVRRPRWPLRNILLIVRADVTDKGALGWVERLARRSGAAVTLLPIVPPFPAMYREGMHVTAALDVLLANQSVAAECFGRYARRLRQRRIRGTLYQHSGEPQQQIRQAVAEANHDLIALAAEPYSRLERWWLGELVGPLLRWADRPMLIVK